MGKAKEKIGLREKSASAIGQFIRRVREESKPKTLRAASDEPPATSLASHYDAAQKDRTNRDWTAAMTSADLAMLDSLDLMMARSRSAIRNDGFAASAQGGYARYVVGGGITARSAGRDPNTGKMLTGYNKVIDLRWEDWSKNPRIIDAEQTKTLAEKQRLWVNEWFAVGGVFINLGYRIDQDGRHLVLQELEYEQLDDTVLQYQGRKVCNGIEVGNFGEPIAYHLYVDSHPLNDFGKKSTRILAENVIHLFSQDRVLQKLGLPKMVAVLRSIRNLAMYENNMQIKARTEAGLTGVVEQTQQQSPFTSTQLASMIGAGVPTGETESTDEIQIRIEPGTVSMLPYGRSIKFPTPASPNTQYGPYVTEQLKRIAAGTGLDIATVNRWYADGNFSSQRQAKLDIYAETDPIQDMIIDKVMRPIRRKFVENEIYNERITAAGYLESDIWRAEYLRTNWKGPAKPSIDRAKDAAADKLEISNGTRSPQDICNENGRELRDVLTEISEARQMCNELGLSDLFDNIFGKTDPREPRPDKSQPEDNGGLNRAIHERLVLDAIFGGNGDNGHGQP